MVDSGSHSIVARVFAVLQQRVRAQEHKAQALTRSLVAWRRNQLSRHLLHWRRMVCEGRLEALFLAMDKWRRYAAVAERSRVLDERCAMLRGALERQQLERCLHWWSLISDIGITQRRSCMAVSLRGLQAGTQACALRRVDKRRAKCFYGALVLTCAFRHWRTCASDERCVPAPLCNSRPRR